MTTIGFTGSQSGMSLRQLQALLAIASSFAPHEFHHGDCIGADAEAHDLFTEFGWLTVIHPPDEPRKRAFKNGDKVLAADGYLVRNHSIVDSCALLIAAPSTHEEVLRSGTWATVRYARRQAKPTIVLER